MPLPVADVEVLAAIFILAASAGGVRRVESPLRSRILTHLCRIPSVRNAVKLIVPEGVRHIGFGALEHAPLEEVVLPMSLRSIRANAFASCRNLFAIAFPYTLCRIDDHAFENCTRLETATFAWRNLMEIGDRAFAMCGFSKIHLPDSIGWIGAAAFLRCAHLVEIKLPKDRLTSIQENMFRECTALESVELPNSVRVIGEAAFCDCKKLRMVGWPKHLEKIGAWAFSGCDFRTLCGLPSTLELVGTGAFAQNMRLSFVWWHQEMIPDVPKWCFYGCRSLVGIVLPRACTTVGESCFQSCPVLSIVVAPQNVAWGRPTPNINCPRLSQITRLCPAGLVRAAIYERWSLLTHGLCRPEQKEWIRFVLTLLSQRLQLPSVCALEVAKALLLSDI